MNVAFKTPLEILDVLLSFKSIEITGGNYKIVKFVNLKRCVIGIYVQKKLNVYNAMKSVQQNIQGDMIMQFVWSKIV